MSAADQLLSELAATRDGQRSGAVDVAWPGAAASLFFVFGQPSHATVALESGESLSGPAALDHLLAHMPDAATVQPWRRVMVPEDTLRLSVDELVQRVGAAPTVAAPPPPPRQASITVDDFPLLPLGVSLWSDAAANVVHLDMLAPKLPDSVVVLTADGVRAATVIAHGSIVDSVYVDGASCLLGDDATEALMHTTNGTISGYGLDDERLLASIPLLWRARRVFSGLHASWLDVEHVVADIRDTGMSCALLVAGQGGGAALFHDGQLVGTYTEQRRTPSGSPASLRALLRSPGATVTLLAGGPALPVERALAEEAFHQFIAAPPADDEPVADAVDEPTLAADPRGFDPGEQVLATGGRADPAYAGAEPAMAHFPPDVFTLPDLDLVPPPPAFAMDEPGVAGDEAAETEPISAAAETAATLGLVLAPAPEPPATNGAHTDDIAAAAAALAEDATTATSAAAAEADAADAEFVPARLEFDVAALRKELIDIATVWLGQADVAPVSRIIKRTRPGVDEFVGAVARIGALQVPGHEPAVVRAMAREMHFRVAEVLCAV